MLFCLKGYIKVFLPPLPWDLPELQRQTIVAISEISHDKLQQVWVEMDYQLDVCLVTKGGHIQHLGGTKQNLEKFLFPYVGRRLQYFQLSSVQFYKMCEGIMNYPAYCNLWPVRLCHIFPHYLIKGIIFKKGY